MDGGGQVTYFLHNTSLKSNSVTVPLALAVAKMPGFPGMALMSKGFHNRGMVLIHSPVATSQSLRV